MSKTFYSRTAGFAAGMIFMAGAAYGVDTPPARFLGANSCASSGCHGGGGTKQNQFLVWSLKDFHSQRPAATLTTARSKQIAEALEIKEPATDMRCTSCHAPLHEVPANLRGENLKTSEGVSCESCHGPAEYWLRSHTRKDYTCADRVAAGMRDLQNLYVRANTCVACHQAVSQPLLKAGHPELLFELDGQSVAEPKHWSAEKNGNGAQAWLVGQAVALREMSWKLASEKTPAENEINRWRGLVWVVARAGKMDSRLPAPPDITFRPSEENFQLVQKWSDELAATAANTPWSDSTIQSVLTGLANTSEDFSAAIPKPVAARRAERLVLALDRLFTGKNNPRANAELNHLVKLAQSLPDFDPKKFAGALEKFSQSIK